MTLPPANYDDVGSAIKFVDPDGLWREGATTIKNLNDDVVAKLNDISTTWQGLKLSWTGQSATAADDFNNKWTAVMTRLFGPTTGTAGPGEAILPRICSGIQVAASNLGGGEDAVVKTFAPFSAPPPANPSTDGTRTDTTSPVTEVATNKPPAR